MNVARLKTWSRYMFSTLVIAGLVVYLWRNWEDVEGGMSLSVGQLCLLVALILLTWVLNSLPMLIFVRLMHGGVGFWENLFVSVAGGLGNYLPMRIGTVVRMRFFRKVHGLDYIAFVGIMGVRVLLLLALSGILGCVGLVGLIAGGEDVPLTVLLVFALMAIVPLLAMHIPIKPSDDNQTRWGRLLCQLAAGHSVLRTNPWVFGLLIMILLAQFAVLSLRLLISFQVFGYDLPMSALLLLGPVTTLLTFLSLTPGNLGLREWIIGGLAVITGIDFKNGVFAGTLDRSLLMALSFLIGPFCLYYTLRKTDAADAMDVEKNH